MYVGLERQAVPKLTKDCSNFQWRASQPTTCEILLNSMVGHETKKFNIQSKNFTSNSYNVNFALILNFLSVSILGS